MNDIIVEVSPVETDVVVEQRPIHVSIAESAIEVVVTDAILLRSDTMEESSGYWPGGW